VKALVTGYSGFLGRHVARALRAEGWTIRVLLHQKTVARNDLIREVDEVIWGSAVDQETICQAVAGVQALVHCAWAHRDPGLNERAAELLAAESVSAGVQHFVFVSSVAVYGMSVKSTAPVHEAAQLALGEELKFAYPAEKIRVEKLLLAYRRNAMKLAILRPGPIFDDRKSPCKKIVRIGRHAFAIGLGTGRNRMPYIHARDVGRAVAAWLKHGAADQIFNVTPSQCLRVGDWYRQWGRAHHMTLNPIFIRPLVIRSLSLALTVLKSVFGKPGKVDSSYAIASATRDLIYSNEAIKRNLGWTDESTKDYYANTE